MSSEHIYRADQLIALFEEFLSAFRQGRAPDVVDFNQRQERAFAELAALGPYDPNHQYARAFQERLYYLSMQNEEAKQVVTKLMVETRKRLSTTTTKRRGLSGYKRNLVGRQPKSKGVWRGRG